MDKNQNIIASAANSVWNLYLTCIFVTGGAMAFVVAANMLTTGLELGNVSRLALGFYFVGFALTVAIMVVSPRARGKAKLLVVFPFGLVLASAMGSMATSVDGAPVDPRFLAIANSAVLFMYIIPVCIAGLLFILAYEERVANAKV
jgi:hypothetical protein